MRKLSRPFIISTILSFAFIIYYLILPSDPKTGILLGYSASRLASMALLMAAAVLFFVLALKLPRLQRPMRWLEDHVLAWADGWLFPVGLGLALAVGIVFSNLPGYWFDEQAIFFERLKPLILWATLLVALLFGWLGICKGWFSREKLRTWATREKKTIRLGLMVFGGMALLALGIAISRVGLVPDAKYWNPGAVPLLGMQVFGALLAAILIGSWLDAKLRGSGKIRKLDLLVGLMIWALAAVIWISQPAQKSFFFPGAFPPNYQWYPISDSQVYDLSAINAAQGGFELSDKPAYIFLLSMFHLVSGFNYQNIVMIQQIWLALLPVFIYMIGLLLHNRRAGLFAALLITFQTLNAIPGAILIPTTTVRQFMSENPTAWGLALSTLLLLIWQREGKRSFSGWLVLAGAALGFTFYLRAATALILPLLFFYLIKRSGKRFNLLPIASFMIGFLLLVMPLAGRQMVELGQSPMFDKIMFVINDRLVPRASKTIVATQTRAVTKTPAAAVANTLAPKKSTMPTILSTPAPKKSAEPTVVSTPVLKKTSVPAAASITKTPEVSGSAYENPIRFIPAHFMNNLIKSAFVLPMRLAFDDLPTAANEDFYQEDGNWQGQISAETGVLLLANLALICLGISAGFGKKHFFALIPMGMLLLYFLGSAVSRTSGGRYLIPVLWVVLIYFAGGVMKLVQAVWPAAIQETSEADDAIQPVGRGWRRWLPVLASIFMAGVVGISLAFYSRWVPAAQPEKKAQSALFKQAIAKDVPGSMNLTNAEVNRFLKQGKAVLLSGRLYYPNQLSFSSTIPMVQNEITSLVYPRLLFTLMNGNQRVIVILPQEGKLVPIADDSDVLVLGCKFNIGYLTFVHAYSVVLNWQEDAQTLVRPYETKLTCPLREPVCNNNRECR